jgi:ppGpp synthetase/RelA/SpoT-type nucleotidyltranferase
MTESEFITRYKADIPIYSEWGNFVTSEISHLLSKKLAQVDFNLYLKIPPVPRVKEINSIISKAFYRGKNYKDVYSEITDKVGVRFVVLLQEDIWTISKVIENNSSWVFSKDRDFEEERLKEPLIFDYQSVHYVVSSKKLLTLNEKRIPKNTPCEIQIRTLLQHAYSELTHDTIYKPKNRTSPQVLRMVAKSMALIETTNDLFSKVQSTLESSGEAIMSFLLKLKNLYRTIAVPETEEKLNIFIIDSLQDILLLIDFSDIEKFIQKRSDIKDIISKKYNDLLIYRQPIVLLIYYLVNVQRYKLQKLWPLTDEELRPLFIDLGFTLS